MRVHLGPERLGDRHKHPRGATAAASLARSAAVRIRELPPDVPPKLKKARYFAPQNGSSNWRSGGGLSMLTV